VKFTELPIEGAWRIESQRRDDERGFLARTWSRAELVAHGLGFEPAETSLSFNAHQRTVRGLHYQAAPNTEVKLVTCVTGRVWDVVLDLRPASPSFKRWHAEELDGLRPTTLYIPTGCAHGFMTLSAGATLLYEIAPAYVQDSVRVVRWNDPAFGIEWPAEPLVISDRDRMSTDFSE
jgi:dTDP-4-dehydrorhamnose 3,5-epimerase